MRTENRRVHTSKPWTPEGKFSELPDSVEVHIIDDDSDDSSKDYSVEDALKQLAIYHPEITHDRQTDIDHYASPQKKTRHGYGTVLPSIGTYTVQCDNCYKWRIVPTKEKYQELRENISQELFVCARACEWNRELSCDEPDDVSQDGSRVWAIDRPNIVQPPPGWDREVRLRGAPAKFADVYYTSSGKKLRSLVEVGRYLEQNPHYIREGVNLSQFSFAIPKPLEENYVRKCRSGNDHGLLEFHDIDQVDPLCWAAPPTRRELLGELGLSALGSAGTEQPEMSSTGSVGLHQLKVSEPPAQHRKTVKQVSSRKCRMTTPAARPCPQSPLTSQHSSKSCERGYCALSLLISDGIHPGLCGFFPHSRRICFKNEMDIDLSDILYSNGDWFLIREGNVISFWNVSLEQKWHVTEAKDVIHQGYFSGSPPFDCMVVLATQSELPAEPALGKEEQTVTSLWLGSIKDDVQWREEKVTCSYEERGMNSIILFRNMIMWLSDKGSLCSVKQNSEGIQFSIHEAACNCMTLNFSLVHHSDKLYIVKSGGFLPCELPGIYEVILGSETSIQETVLYGKDIYVVHKMGGFIIQSNLDDCRIFTGSLLPDVECAMFSYKSNHNDKIMLCQSALHLACNTVWTRHRTVAQL